MEPFDLVDDIKTKIDDHINVASFKQHLVFNGTPLEDDRTLKDCNFQRGSTFRLATCLHDVSMKIDVKTSNGGSLNNII